MKFSSFFGQSNSFHRVPLLIRTISQLGWKNIYRILLYRILSQSGYFQWILPSQPIQLSKPRENSPYSPAPPLYDDSFLRFEALELMSGRHRYYGGELVQGSSPPNWFFNPFNQSQCEETSLHWSKLEEFELLSGDIKDIWELSRMSWAPLFCQWYRASNDPQAIECLQSWIVDWVDLNPPYQGPNWKCAQETSIRLMNVLLGDRLLGFPDQHREMVRSFVIPHLRRILPSMMYARAQDNNHGISEAAGLIIGGSWLTRFGGNSLESAFGKTCLRKGMKNLERNVQRLFEKDGTFSQRSTNYHRLALDTLSLVVTWSHLFQEIKLSQTFFQRAQAATHWLAKMTDSTSGVASNFGSNDGAILLSLARLPYRDMRPSLQLASALFLSARLFPPGAWDDLLSWLEVPLPENQVSPEKAGELSNGRFILLGCSNNWGMLHVPHYRFRPTQSDILHFDWWYQGENILRDVGSYRYNAPLSVLDQYAGAVGHNVVQFGEKNQLPRIGRFLFGNWRNATLVTHTHKEKEQSATARFTDEWEETHTRTVIWQDRGWIIIDRVESPKSQEATLRWHLPYVPWEIDQDTVRYKDIKIRCFHDQDKGSLSLVQKLEAPTYGMTLPIFALELKTSSFPTRFETHITLSS